MEINIEYEGKDYKKIEKIASLAYKEVKRFFDKKPNSPARVHRFPYIPISNSLDF